MIEVGNGTVAVTLDDAAAIRSLRGLDGRDVLMHDERLPAFVVQYIDPAGRFRSFTSARSARHDFERCEDRGQTLVRVRHHDLAGLGFAATVTMRCPQSGPMTYWSLELTQPDGYLVADVQFPFVVVPYRYNGGAGATTVVVPMGEGRLLTAPRPEDLPPDHPSTWQFVDSENCFDHYPGTTFAQFLACYDDHGGVYLGCHDTHGAIKNLKPVHHPAGLRLGVSHVVGWSGAGTRDLGYEVALGVFTGDWHAAADLYRDWYTTAVQPTKLTDRTDVPSWLLDSPLHVILRAQGELDTGPAFPNPEVVPYTNALPLLDTLSESVDAPLLPVVMSWEGPGPWVYPESFPVAGGDDAMRAFTAAARARHWHVGTYCNGTQWVTEHKWTGYDGWRHFAEGGGPDSVCRTPDGQPWRNGWDVAWRTSFTGCVAAERTRELARDYVSHLLELGFDWVQFLDQNCGAAAFPCYSSDHGHPPAPGRWMTGALDTLIDAFDDLAARAGRDIAYSVESAPNDYALSRFSICDIRPDLSRDSRSIPLYQYLFHEYILTQAAFAPGPNPYWMELKTATSFAFGDVLTAILGRGGRLNTWSGTPWSPWDTPPGDQEAVLTLLRRATALRRQVGRDYLVLGRLLPQSPVSDVDNLTWQEGTRAESAPAVMHAAWQAQDGRRAAALCNWTKQARTVRLTSAWNDRNAVLHLRANDQTHAVQVDADSLELPPLSAAVLERGP